MFDDVAEFEYVLYLLDQTALNPNLRERVTHKEIVTAIDGVARKVHSREIKHQTKPGQSRHAKIISDLYCLLEKSDRVDKLNANLDAIKDGLKSVYGICLDENICELKPIADVGKKVIAGGKAAHEKTYGSESKISNDRKKWQLLVDEYRGKYPNYTFEDIKRFVVKNNPGQVSMSQLKRYTKDPKPPRKKT